MFKKLLAKIENIFKADSLMQTLDKSIKLEHYSPIPKLSHIDPKYKKTGVDARAKGRDTEHPHSFYYVAGTAPEDLVTGVAQSKYTVQLSPEHKIYDLGTDPENHIPEAKKANQGVLNPDMVHERIKSAGYHGFTNSQHEQLPNVVALYHVHPVESEESIKRSELKKAPAPYEIDPADENWSYANSLSHFLNPNQNFSYNPKNTAKVTVQRPDKTFYHRIITPHRTVHLITQDKKGDNPIAHMLVDHMNGSTPMVTESVVDNDFRGKGHGKALYLNALKHHGNLLSDERVSPEANKLYQKLATHPNVKAKLAPYNEYSSTSHSLEFVKQPKKLAASESLQKMSQPRITFPKIKNITTRPDQEVQIVENKKQQDLLGRKVANQVINDIYQNRAKPKSYPDFNKDTAKKVSNSFNSKLGVVYQGRNKAFAAAKGGKLRAKYENNDPVYNAKLKQHKIATENSWQDHKKNTQAWLDKVTNHPDKNSSDYFQLINSRPEWKKPRAPAKRTKDTKSLNPEQMKTRGQSVDSTIQHEGLHYTLGQIDRKHGFDVYSNAKKKLLGFHDPETVSHIADWISTTRRYKKNDPRFDEELLAHARDILVNKGKREEFKNFLQNKIGLGKDSEIKRHINNLKRGHYQGYKWAQDATVDELKNAGQEKLAASEQLFKSLDKALDSGLNLKRPQVKLNPEHGKIIAEAYENMKHDPNHPEVKAAYSALINETKNQYQDMLNQGFKFTPMKSGQENPYKTSKDVHQDLKQNKHLHYFPTRLGYGSEGEAPLDHPMLQPTEFKDAEGQPMLANDLFRVVHDYRGHHLGGETGFGEKGEHQAFLTHKKDFSPMAQKALATETMGQNQWVNNGPHAEHNKKNPYQTKYADQKAGLLPDHIINGRWHE